MNILKHSKPKTAIIDFDYPIFYSASAAEQTWYVYYDEDYNEVARFKSADEGKGWIEEFEILGGIDLYGRFSGDPSTLIREVEWEPKKFSIATSSFNMIKEEWLELVNCDSWKGKCAPMKGATVFRKNLASITPYKGNRKGSRKPKHLDKLRKWALQDNPQLSKVLGPFETDDIVCAMAQKMGDTAVVVQEDKDVRTVRGTWFIIPSSMSEPVYSPSDSVGAVWLDGKKLSGYGWLFLLGQSLMGDQADNVAGCKGVGPSTAVNLLSHLNDKHESHLKEAVEAAAQPFMERYGEEYEYQHCTSGETVKASWKDIMKENVTLVYMVKNKDDAPFEILSYIEDM